MAFFLSYICSMKDYLIIVAGGTGDRMGASMPKQFLELDGKPVLMHTIDVFRKWNADLQIILVLHPEFTDYWMQLCNHHNFVSPAKVVKGGKTRFHSVKNGLDSIEAEIIGVVGVHDAVRPLVTDSTIDFCYREAREKGSAIPVVEIFDSIRVMLEDDSHVVDRKRYRAVQTPQCFDGVILKKAYNQDYRESFTDSASVVEATGAKVFLVQGNRDNIKLTTRTDMAVAAAILIDRS